MDKVTLNKEQLNILVDYIHRCSFKEPLVVMEILDHFACKVEEKLAEHPDYNLQVAMIKAHDDFGVMGFHPIASQYKDGIFKKYRKLFFAQIKKILSSPIGMILCFGAGVLIYKVYMWILANHIAYRGDSSIYFYALMLCCLVTFILLRFKLLRKKKNNSIIMGAVINVNNVWHTPLLIVFVMPPEHHRSPFGMMLGALWLAIFIVAYCVSEIAFYRVSKMALKDIEESEAHYNAVLD